MPRKNIIIIEVIGLIASLITIFVFVSGWDHIKDIFSKPTDQPTLTPHSSGVGVGMLWWELKDVSGQVVDSGKAEIFSSDIEKQERMASNGSKVYDETVPINKNFQLRMMATPTTTKPGWSQDNPYGIPLALRKTDQDLFSFEIFF